MFPKESGFNESETTSGFAHAHRDAFLARLPWQEMVKLNKGIIFVITETLFSSFLSSSYAGHVTLAAAKPWQFMLN